MTSMTQASPGGQSKLTVRKPKFDFSNGAPRHWLKNSGLLTHVMNSLSLMFPEGERFFIRSVNRFSDKIKTAEMQQSLRKHT